MNYSMPSQNAYYASSSPDPTRQSYEGNPQLGNYLLNTENEQHWVQAPKATSIPQAYLSVAATTDRRERRRPKYTRSRNGCLVCRAKKVKCDEAKPSCQRCINSNRDCSWPTSANDAAKRAGPRRKQLPDELSVETSSDVSGDFDTSNENIADASDELLDYSSTDSLYLKAYPETQSYSVISSARTPITPEYTRQHYAPAVLGVSNTSGGASNGNLVSGHVEIASYRVMAATDTHVPAVSMTNRSALNDRVSHSQTQAYQVDHAPFQASQSPYTYPKAEQTYTYGRVNSAQTQYSNMSQTRFPHNGIAISRSCRTSLNSGINMEYSGSASPESFPSSRPLTNSSISSTADYSLDNFGRWIPSSQSTQNITGNEYTYGHGDAHQQHAQGPPRTSWMQ